MPLDSREFLGIIAIVYRSPCPPLSPVVGAVSTSLSLVRAADPRRFRGCGRDGQPVEERAGVGVRNHNLPITSLDEPLGDAAIELFDQRVVEAAHVEQSA